MVAWSWFVFGCALTIAVMRRAAFESWLLSILVFPLLGVVFIAVHWHETMRSLRLLENGRLARGRLVGQEDGGFVEDVGRLAKLRFRIEDAETHEVELTVTIPVPQRLKDDGYAWLLYDPARRSRQLVRDAIPPGVRVDADGQLRFHRPIATALVLLVPVATAAACAFKLAMK